MIINMHSGFSLLLYKYVGGFHAYTAKDRSLRSVTQLHTSFYLVVPDYNSSGPLVHKQLLVRVVT